MNNQGIQLEWINSSNPSISKDLEIRAKIRKQAMKKAAITRRANGNYGKYNLRQLPVFEQSITDNVAAPPSLPQIEPSVDSFTNVEGLDADNRPNNSRNIASKGKIAQAKRIEFGFRYNPHNFLSSTGYQTARIKFDFDVPNLSSLTTFHISRITLSSINASATQLVQLLQTQQWSFFSYVPSRYGQNTCLTLATDCLLSRINQILSPENSHWQLKVISSYLKALQSLQKAIDSPSERFNPEILCATEILALYELLNPAGTPEWMRHAAGISRLIQLRGPENFKTEFEKSLFMAHVGPIITESILNNERCFLDQDPWKDVFRSIITHSPVVSERSDLVIQLLIFKSCIPGIFKDITDWVYESKDDNTPSLRNIATKVRELQANLLQWRKQHEALIDLPKTTAKPVYEKRCKLYSTYLAISILVYRLLASISYNRRYLEKGVQVLADELLNIEPEMKSVSKDASTLFLVHNIGLAHAIKATTQEWEEMSEWEMERGMIERGKFERWSRLCGRAV